MQCHRLPASGLQLSTAEMEGVAPTQEGQCLGCQDAWMGICRPRAHQQPRRHLQKDEKHITVACACQGEMGPAGNGVHRMRFEEGSHQ